MLLHTALPILLRFHAQGTFEVTIEIAGGQGNDAFCAVVQFDIKTKHK